MALWRRAGSGRRDVVFGIQTTRIQADFAREPSLRIRPPRFIFVSKFEIFVRFCLSVSASLSLSVSSSSL